MPHLLTTTSAFLLNSSHMGASTHTRTPRLVSSVGRRLLAYCERASMKGLCRRRLGKEHGTLVGPGFPRLKPDHGDSLCVEVLDALDRRRLRLARRGQDALVLDEILDERSVPGPIASIIGREQLHS